MSYTAPQLLLLETIPTLDDYMVAIKRKPGALEFYVDKARKAGFGVSDLKALYGFALKNRIINLNDYKFHIGRLDLQRERGVRETGKIDKRDLPIKHDEDNAKNVLCTKCNNNFPATQSKLVGHGWVCSKCLGRTPTVRLGPSSESDTVNLNPQSEIES